METQEKSKMSRKDRIAILRKKLASISEEQRNEIAKNLAIVTVEGRLLSPYNQVLLGLQLQNPSVVGGFKQWLKAGRCVRKGEHGALIFFPVGDKDENGNVEDAEKFFTATVFDISQTDELSKN